MDELVYVWVENNYFCTREDLEDSVEDLGDNYQVMTIGEYEEEFCT